MKAKSNHSDKRQKIKMSLTKKYGISDEQAEEILKQFEKKHENRIITDTKNNPNSNIEHYTQNKNLIKQKNSSNKIDEPPFDKKASEQKKTSEQNPQSKQYDVDEIVGDIIPEYNKNISIELKNVNLTFDLDSEQVDTIKEQVIMKIRRKNVKTTKFHVLKDITFKIYQGEKVGIIGFNGAGKSTLLKVICGIYPPDNGEVFTSGNISPFLSLGLGFDSRYTGRKNIFLNGAILGYDKEFLKNKEQDIINFSELGDFIDVPLRTYSSGMRAKLGFSIATLVEPDILVLDEVLSVGDARFKKKSADKMRSLMGGKTTVLLVSHSISQIRSLCDKAIWIENGEIKEIGEVNKVCDHYVKAAENATYEQLRNLELD